MQTQRRCSPLLSLKSVMAIAITNDDVPKSLCNLDGSYLAVKPRRGLLQCKICMHFISNLFFFKYLPMV